MNKLREFWIKHQNAVAEHWPMALLHLILVVYLAGYLMEKYI